MFRSKIFVVLAVCACLSLSTGAVMSQERVLPADCVAYVYCKNLGQALNNVRTFVDTVQPGLGQMVSLLLTQVFKNPMMMGVDQNGSFSMVFLNPEKYKPARVTIIPFLKQDQLLTAMTGRDRNLGPTQTGVTAYARQEFDKKAFEMATPEEKQNYQQFMREAKYFLGTCPKHVVIADDEAACALVTGWVKAGTLDLSNTVQVQGDVVAGVSVGELMTIYEDTLDEKLAPLKQIVQMGAAMQNVPDEGTVNVNATMGIINAYIDAIVSLLKQVDMAEVGLQLGADGLRVRARVTAKDGTGLQDAFLAQGPGQHELLKYLATDSLLVAGVRWKVTDAMSDAFVDFAMKLLDAMAPAATPEERDTLMAAIHDSMQVYTGELALNVFISAGEAPGITLVEILRCTDPQKAVDLMLDDTIATQWFRFYQNIAPGFKIEVITKRAAETYRGVNINETAMLLDVSVPDAIKDAITKMYGDPMVIRTAIVNDIVLVTFGKESVRRMHQQIDLVLQGGGDLLRAESFTSATVGFPADTNLMLVVNGQAVQELIASSLAKGAQPGAAQAPPAPAGMGGVGAYAVVKGSELSGELYVPMHLIMNVKNAIMGQLGAGAPMPGQPPAPAPAPMPQ